MKHLKRAWLQCAALTLAAVVPAVDAAVSISGTGMAQPGNNGNVTLQHFVYASGPGSYSVGPFSGTQGGNTAKAEFTIANLPQPALSATATAGEDGTLAVNGGFASVNIDFVYGFHIVGPQDGIAIPIIFTGFTDGTTSFTGNGTVRSRDEVGTSFRVNAPAVGYTFHSIASDSFGTTGTTYISNGVMATVGWGASAPFTVGYTDYSSSFAYGATLYSGVAGGGTMELRLLAAGGTTGSASPPGAPAVGQTTAFIDPIISIDPDWLSQHPGYTVVVDEGIGNGTMAPVPEPSTWCLLLSTLPMLAWRKRKTH